MGRTIAHFTRTHYKFTITAIATIMILFILRGMTTDAPVTEASTMNEKYYQCITIQEDETLWDIASTYCSEEYDTYDDYITEVKHINNLHSDKIYSGACLVIPYYAAPQ